MRAAAVAGRLPADSRDTRVRQEHLHVTLHHLGDHHGVPEPVVQMAQRAALAAASATSCFELAFEQVQRFDRQGRNAATVLTGEAGLLAVRALQVRLGAEMKRAGLGQWVEKSFTPHMTLLYGRGTTALQAVEPVAWMVRELVLVHSFLGETRHEALGRWPFRG